MNEMSGADVGVPAAATGDGPRKRPNGAPRLHVRAGLRKRQANRTWGDIAQSAVGFVGYDPQTPQKLIPPPPGRFGAAIGKAVVAGPTTAGLRWVEWG